MKKTILLYAFFAALAFRAHAAQESNSTWLNDLPAGDFHGYVTFEVDGVRNSSGSFYPETQVSSFALEQSVFIQRMGKVLSVSASGGSQDIMTDSNGCFEIEILQDRSTADIEAKEERHVGGCIVGGQKISFGNFLRLSTGKNGKTGYWYYTIEESKGFEPAVGKIIFQ